MEKKTKELQFKLDSTSQNNNFQNELIDELNTLKNTNEDLKKN